jgi:Cytidylate kinase
MQTFKMYDVTPYRGLTLLQLLKQFHDKFGTPYDEAPRHLGRAELEFRLVCHTEEANEYLDAVSEGNLVEAIDALGDEIYFLTGTAHRQGFMDLVIPTINMVPMDVGPRFLPLAAQELRRVRHNEVLKEYEVRARTGELWQQKLALKEALNTFYRTAMMHGFDIQEALLRIHAANMAKDVDPAKQRRTKALAEEGIDAAPMLEITKPDGWLAPYLGDLVGLGPYEALEEEFASIERGYLTPPCPDLSKLHGLVTIDGPDASGKSTLAARIAELTGGQVIHLTWSPRLEAVMDEYRTSAIKYAAVLAQNGVVVLERPWLSHPVYAEVYRDGAYQAEHVHNWKNLTEHNARLNIVALPGCSKEWLKNYLLMCSQRDELHGPNAGKAMAVYEGFRDAFSGDAGPERQPAYNVDVYDMQQYPNPVDIDTFILNNVVPHLTPKEL